MTQPLIIAGTYVICTALEIPDKIASYTIKPLPLRNDEVRYTREDVILFIRDYVKEFVGPQTARLTIDIRFIEKTKKLLLSGEDEEDEL